MRAVFLDRDGTVNREVDVLRRADQLRLLPGVGRAIKELNRLGYLVFIVTNQPVIARGWLSEKEVERIHELLLARLSRFGANVEAVYYCPHHPNADLKKYRSACRCRKPKPGMIIRAIKEHRISKRGSFMIGDHAWDILAGRAAGLKTIKVETSSRSAEPKYAHIKADYVAKDLAYAVRIIKSYARK